MPVISPAAASAREASRTSAGTFGEQQRSAPELTLDDYAYPTIVGGLLPDQVGINVWISGYTEDGTPNWRVCAFPWDEEVDGFPNADLDKPIFDSFELPLSAEHAAELGTEDHWTTLNAAPTWLRDVITPSVADDTNLHPGPAGSTAAWRKQRHDRLIAEGAFATTYDNSYLISFEDEYPRNLPEDAAAALFDLGDIADDANEDEREQAAAELSRRATTGVGGALIDARELVPGDQISLSWLADHFPDAEKYRTGYATVDRPDRSGAEGDVYIRLTDGELLRLPIGARVPAVGFDYQGITKSPAQIVRLLARSGALPPTAMQLAPAEAIATYNAGLGADDPDFISPRNPTLTAAVV